MSKPVSENVELVKKVIAGEQITTTDLLGLVLKLKKERGFGLARRLLEKHQADSFNRRIPAPDNHLKRKLTQQLSLCTYKDPDLNPLSRLERALKILESLDDLDLQSQDCTRDQETLGQTGAIFKRKWELTNQPAYLETSLAYYAHGYEQGVAGDFGYTGINAAFVLDLLASMESNESEGDDKRRKARQIREDIVAVLGGLAKQSGNEWLLGKWWFFVTMAEAYFGLQRYTDAQPWLQSAAALPDVAEWEWETTARQLARLLKLQKPADQTTAKAVLREFLGERAAGLDALLKGKIGLALSGGGFRASLFHIGVLARLAELDLLRDVEYLSCVSGGSIIGAHYYLEVRNLLHSKADADITRQDYLDIVERLQKDFLAGVQTNIRVRVLSDFWANAKMIYSNDYSRTNRLGELYEEMLFSRIQPAPTATGEFILSDLKVQPKDETAGFSPKDQNWRRAAKVPILVLNATPLNTGHNWQFTTTWMGEPPAEAGSEIDANYRLRRMYYEDAPAPHDKMRLGYAVAASSCVPGLFEPLPLNGLYKDKAVRLVDGGVHDNQGAAALLEQGCTVLLVSDASGQMDALDEPGKGLLEVPLRANSILQARLRESQYQDIDARRQSGLLQGLMFIHLKKKLEGQVVDWIDCQDPSDPVTADPLLPYGIQREVQAKLAAVRTDLDSFSDAEAYALMHSAYAMTKHALTDSLPSLGFETESPKPTPWKFLEIEEEMRRPGLDTPLMRQLKVADRLFLKVWSLSKRLQFIGRLIVISLLALLGLLAYQWWSVPFTFTWGQIISALFMLALATSMWKPILDWVQYRKTAQDILIGLGMVFLGSWLAKLHLKVFDQWFLAQGRLDELKKQGK